MKCQNCNIDMEYEKRTIEFETAGTIDIVAYMCPKCSFQDVEVGDWAK